MRHQLINDLPLGRNVDETLRMVDALQFYEENGEVCPAGWEPGKPGMKADSAGVAEYLARTAIACKAAADFVKVRSQKRVEAIVRTPRAFI